MTPEAAAAAAPDWVRGLLVARSSRGFSVPQIARHLAAARVFNRERQQWREAMVQAVIRRELPTGTARPFRRRGRRRHTHGSGGQPGTDYGHRAAHCVNTPDSRPGYRLTEERA